MEIIKYAILDFDYTLREGYGVYDFASFLFSKNFLDQEVLDKMNKQSSLYDLGELTHDELACIACEIFASGLRGKSLKEFESLAEEYIPAFRKDIYPFVDEVFAFMSQENIKPIIISGAPQILLKRLQKPYNLFEIYGFECESIDGILTGNVKNNYGYNKEKITNELIEKYGLPYIGIGDSDSDIYFIKKSKYSIFIGDENIVETNLKLKTSDDDITIQLENLIKEITSR